MFLERRTTFPYIITRTSQNIKNGDLGTHRAGQPFGERDTGVIHKRQKPVELYSALLKNFMHDNSLYVVDACSGAGSCALAYRELGINCLVLEKSNIKVRLINQRAK